MQHIATLGPRGTFSEKAANQFIETQNGDYQIELYGSIKQVLRSIGTDCKYGVLPIENLSEGFITLVLDHLVNCDLKIIAEIQLPIAFSFVGNGASYAEIEKVFVQFVSKGQCAEFLERFDEEKIETTESNIESLERVHLHSEPYGAIVPSGSFIPEDFQLIEKNVQDFHNNQTRFVVLSDEVTPSDQSTENYKTSIIVLDDNDRPGLLEGILSLLSKRGVNLTSIISRPSRYEFGRYHFFIDFEGHVDDKDVAEALAEIDAINKTKVLGSYLKAGRL